LDHLKNGKEDQVGAILKRIKGSDIREATAEAFADILSGDNLGPQSQVDSIFKNLEPPVIDPSASSSNAAPERRRIQTESASALKAGHPKSLSDDLSRVISRLDVNDVGEVHYFGPSSNLNLVSDVRRVPAPRAPCDRSSSFSSTAGTSDLDTGLILESTAALCRVDTALSNNSSSPPGPVDDSPAATALEEHLLSLYWTWQHPFFLLFSRRLFQRDMQASRVAASNDAQKGRWPQRVPRMNHFSPLLINAILAHAAHLSDRPEVRSDPLDSTTAGDPYFARARRLLEAECENPSMTTVQALALMGSREAGCGRDTGLGWLYSGAVVLQCAEG
jgi:hypothetical protein